MPSPRRPITHRTICCKKMSLRTGDRCHRFAIRTPHASHSLQCFRRGRRLPTVVPADSRPLSWPPIGALPRNRLASPATGGASPISPTPRLHRTPCPAPVGRGALTPPHDTHRTASQKLSLRGAKRRGNPYSPNTKNRPANPAGRSHFLRNMYSLSCPCDAATPAPDPSRTSASCSPPPARHSGGTAHSTSQR